MRPARLISHSVLTVGLAVPALVAVHAASAAADPAGTALIRLDRDADGALTVTRERSGGVRFVGVPATSDVDNPAVDSQTGVQAAADAHLARYGAAVGADAPGSELVPMSIARAASGNDVVRYQQEVGGLPVMGAETVVSLRPDRELGSMLSTRSEATTVDPAVVPESGAADLAIGVAARSAGGREGLQASPGERWVFDPTVVGLAPAPGARSVWRFEVTGGADVRRLVLVDDQTGAILLDLDEINDVNRAVCDNNSALQTTNVPCTSPVRSEGGGASAVTDVNLAYDYAGDTADLYQQLGVDLTDLVGTSIGGTKKLASTVRYCYTGAGNCPYVNAFWNGSQMYYGEGFASADDVVGHEITHGVTERTSNLLYFGQSGAINESLSDIMGEIIDHRNEVGDDVPGNWDLGEDLPSSIGVVRNIANPTLHAQPDKMTSGLWTADTPSYNDSGGVHTNSGVGNKTFYLISQGGSFNGQTITGIDSGSDTGATALLKSARLYLDVDQSLTSGSDYADLAAALDQGCQDLLASGTAGFTAADCSNVHKATLATELTTTPTKAPQPTDAPATCPAGSDKRVLFDSETGTPATKFSATGAWARGSSPVWGSNATSGKDSWYDAEDWTSAAMTPHQDSLTFQSPVALPAGQPSYLRFQQWRLLDYNAGTFYDGGTVAVNGDGPAVIAAEPWVNGPSQTISSSFSSPIAGQKAFGGDSFGWVASRLDLTSYAGTSVAPQFTLSFDSGYGYPGWWLDDITVYTCDPSLENTALPTITGTAQVGETLSAQPGTWSPEVDPDYGYQWYRGSDAIAGATAVDYEPTAADVGSSLKVEVTASAPLHGPGTASSAPTSAVANGILAPGVPSITGTVVQGGTLTALPGTWSPAGVDFEYQWLRDGTDIGGATEGSYLLGVADVGTAISVRVTGTRAGYTSASATSAGTGAVVGLVRAGTLRIAGSARVGKKLTASVGSWSPAPLRFSYTWLRNGKAIHRATRSTYTLVGADRGKRIAVRVTGSRTGYASASATSKATAKVRPRGR